jgi:hypothetical protein
MGEAVYVEASLEAAILGWVATHPQGGGERSGRPLVEVLAHELGLEPNPDTLDRLAAALAKLEREERIVLDAAVPAAVDVAPLDLLGTADRGEDPAGAAPAPRIEAYSELERAPWHVQLNWALRTLRDQTDPRTGEGEVELRHAVARLGLNPKDVRHALEILGVLRRVRRASEQGPEVWWVDPKATVSKAALEELQPAPPPQPVASQRRSPVPARSALADLAPIVDALTRLEPRLGQLINELVDAAESLRGMALSQSQLLREQTQEINALRQECDRLFREVADLRQDNWSLRRSSSRSPAADELSAEAASLGAAERRFARTGTEIDDKLRRVTRTMQEVSHHQPDDVDDDPEK